jgi:protoporphyrinogen oxidase
MKNRDKKKIAIIGAGFSGLAAAYDLSKNKNLDISIIDYENRSGGMAAGFKKENWDWTFEDHYHHVFDSDQAFKDFLAELGLLEQMIYKKTKATTYYHGKAHLLDSAISLLSFKEISLLSRLRTGAVLAFLKIVPDSIFLEKYRASQFLQKTMGKQAWEVIWEPLFNSKFARHQDEINMSWFWARVNPRTQTLGYFEGGFQNLAAQIEAKLRERGVKFNFSKKVEKLEKKAGKFQLTLMDLKSKQVKKQQYDLVISTLPSTIFEKMIDLPEFAELKLEGLAALTVLLRLKNKFLKDGSYWMNVNEKGWPFVAVIEHDNFMDAKHYDNESLVYLGRYLEVTDPDFKKTAEQLLDDYRPYLEKINPNFEEDLIEVEVFKSPFAQPVTKVNHSKKLPKFKTSLEGLYWVSMQHVYPFDRGINHAIKKARDFVAWLKKEENLS